MDEFHHLKQLNKITPDPEYALKTRARILITPQKVHVLVWSTFVNSLRSGSVVTIALLVLVVIGGGASLMKYLESSALSSPTLKAEAQAIDMQIELTNVNYKSLPSFAPLSVKRDAIASKDKDKGGNATSSAMNIDEALNALTQ